VASWRSQLSDRSWRAAPTGRGGSDIGCSTGPTRQLVQGATKIRPEASITRSRIPAGCVSTSWHSSRASRPSATSRRS